jgi:hypothetical protein
VRAGRDGAAVTRPVRRHLCRLSLAAALAGMCNAASAEQSSSFRVEQDLYVLLANDKDIGQERIVAPGDAILGTALGYSAAARLAAPVSVLLAGVPIDVPVQYPLPEVRPVGETRSRMGSNARIFCGSQRRPDSIAAPPAGPRGKGRRFDEYVAPCLVDGNRDGQLDSIFLAGTRWASESLLVPIPPVPFSEVTNFPALGFVQIRFEKGSALQGAALKLHFNHRGRELPIRGLRLGAAKKFYPARWTVQRDSYPQVVHYGSTAISVLGYEPDGKRLRVRVDRGFEVQPIEVAF